MEMIPRKEQFQEKLMLGERKKMRSFGKKVNHLGGRDVKKETLVADGQSLTAFYVGTILIYAQKDGY